MNRVASTDYLLGFRGATSELSEFQGKMAFGFQTPPIRYDSLGITIKTFFAFSRVVLRLICERFLFCIDSHAIPHKIFFAEAIFQAQSPLYQVLHNDT